MREELIFSTSKKTKINLGCCMSFFSKIFTEHHNLSSHELLLFLSKFTNFLTVSHNKIDVNFSENSIHNEF